MTNTSISRDPKSKFDDPNFFFEIFIDQQKFCGHPLPVYPTNYDDFLIHYSGGFDMNTGQPRRPHHNQPTIFKFRIESDNEIDSRNLQYDVHLGTKFDYILHRTNLNILASQVKLIQYECELEPTQLLTILTMASEKMRLDGYLLTSNHSMFPDTNGSVAWLHNCPKVRSTLRVTEKCYDRIPLVHGNRVNSVDHITRQTFPSAKEISCQHATQNLFQLDMDNKDSWYALIPRPVVHNKPLVFSPTRLSRTSLHLSFSSNNAGLYTGKQLSQFWNDVKLGYYSKSVIEKITRELVNQNTDSYQVKNDYSSPVYLDNFMSSENFTDGFKQTFRKITFYLENLGIYFALFLLIKLLINVIIVVVKAFQVQKLTGKTVRFSIVLLTATYNLFFLSVLTSIFRITDNKETDPLYETSNAMCIEAPNETKEETPFLYPNTTTYRQATAPQEVSAPLN